MIASRLLSPVLARPAVRIAVAAALVAGAGLAVVAGQGLLAQVEGERGVAPVASNGDFEVGGIAVETTGDTAEEARGKGWKEAQRKAWDKLWQQANPGQKASGLADSAINAMVSAVVIESEQLGPRRYIATLGVIFDRARAGELLGLTGERSRSAPLLVIPVLSSGGTDAVFEYRTPWQRAWAEYKTGASAIDYVRPNGGGGESLLLTAGQVDRRSRSWWRNILDQFGAADVIMPLARLDRQWPGGPVRGTFTARYGPDDQYLGSFSLMARDDDGVPAMLTQAIARLDQMYTQALAAGQLSPDPTLRLESQIDEEQIARLLDRAGIVDSPAAVARPPSLPTPEASTPAVAVASFTLQVATPDAGAVDAGLASLRGTSGVRGASTVSIAIGGTSVMQVSFAGDAGQLRAALQARGWQVSQAGSSLSIRR
ncbi:MAG: heavy-metal-associated domain-containing protein [Novosphingobium sp.]